MVGWRRIFYDPIQDIKFKGGLVSYVNHLLKKT